MAAGLGGTETSIYIAPVSAILLKYLNKLSMAALEPSMDGTERDLFTKATT